MLREPRGPANAACSRNYGPLVAPAPWPSRCDIVAASFVSLIITTEAMIAKLPKKNILLLQ
jgi:hypothetical protein